ncbi:UNVERIFIED_CONTAM: hypothetical protein Scaly_1022100 [Sesamum calycinum]|uniref:Reverse transcriptase domain-containing protein n=1 Tax=Sesamum calycinum TaxID=2727403 RepID=A0AAW2QJL5_9LAMI
MRRIFDDMLHKNVKCYVDDLVVKSKKREDHFHDLRKVFEYLRRYQLKMNPSKCVFGATSRKFLGFSVRQRGTKIEQAKIDAILRMLEPRSIHELKSLQGKLAYLQRLIGWLGDVELEHLSRKDNKQADALAKLASTLSMTDKEARIPICKSWVIPPIFSDDEDDIFQEEENHVMEVFEVEEEDWRQPLVDYLKYWKLPNDLKRRTDTRGEQLVSSITKARSIDDHLMEFSYVA